MAITSIKTGSSFTNLTKYNDFLAGNAAYSPTAYESIATVTVGSGGSSSVTFSSIPTTYQHLQIRVLIGGSFAGGDVLCWFNNDTTNANYYRHFIYGQGSSVTASSGTTGGVIPGYIVNVGGFVQDILDYKNTNKFKTARSLWGYDANGSGFVGLYSGLWNNTSAINRIDFVPVSGTFPQYSKFGLFGIKGA
jgi:hypothetical protein